MKITIAVQEPEYDWGGVYVDGKLVEAGHRDRLDEKAMSLAGIEAVYSEHVMTGADNRTVHGTLAAIQDADDRSWGV